jgi:hypothetical protein
MVIANYAKGNLNPWPTSFSGVATPCGFGTRFCKDWNNLGGHLNLGHFQFSQGMVPLLYVHQLH